MTEFKQLSKQPSLYRCGCSYAYVPDHANVSLLDLGQSWSYGGRYLFCPPNTTTSDTLYEKILSYMASHPMALFSWVENPDEEASRWRVMVINQKSINSASNTRTVPSTKIPFPEVFQVHTKNILEFKEELTVRANEQQINFTNGATSAIISFNINQYYNFNFLENEFHMTIDANGGSFIGNKIIDPTSSTEAIDIGLRYCILSGQADANTGSIPTTTIHMGKPTHQKVSMRFGRFNLLDLFNAKQTYFPMTQNPELSCLLNRAGQPLQLTPTADAAYVYSRDVKSFSMDAGGNLIPQYGIYLTYSGHFTVSGGDTILCGLSGTEYVKLKEGQTHEIEFVPHQNASVDLGKSLEGGELLSSL